MLPEFHQYRCVVEAHVWKGLMAGRMNITKLLDTIFAPYNPDSSRVRFERSLEGAHSDEIDDVCGLCLCEQTTNPEKNMDEYEEPPVIVPCCGTRKVVGRKCFMASLDAGFVHEKLLRCFWCHKMLYHRSFIECLNDYIRFRPSTHTYGTFIYHGSYFWRQFGFLYHS